MTRIIKPALVALAAASLGLTACGGGQVKKDDAATQVKIKSTAEELGMKEEALAGFQAALSELDKAKPDYQLALDGLNKAVELEPEFAEAHYNLGILLMELSQAEDALAHLQKAREIEAEALDYTVALGRCYAVLGQTDEAEPLFLDVVVREPTNLAAKNNLAALNLQKGNEEAALEYLQQVLREDDENVAALKTLGLVYDKQDNRSLAKYMFNKAIRILDKDEKRPMDPDLHNNLGLVFMREGNVPNAVVHFGKAVEADPNYLEARLNLGSILLEYLDYERANEQFTEAVRISPNHCVARLGAAAAAYANSNHQASAEGYEFYLDRCNADHLSSYERIAKLNEGFLNNPKRAIEAYQRLLELSDNEEMKAQYSAMVQYLQSTLDQSSQKTPDAGGEGASDGAVEAPMDEAPMDEAPTDEAPMDEAGEEGVDEASEG